MTRGQLKLYLPSELRAVLVNLLSTSLKLGKGNRVVDHLGSDPWGDLESFRRTIYDPLHGKRPARPEGEDVMEIMIEQRDVDSVRSVLDGLSEAFATGVPWAPLTEIERDAVERLIAELHQG